MLMWTFQAVVVMAAYVPNIGYDALGTKVVKINFKSRIIAINIFRNIQIWKTKPDIFINIDICKHSWSVNHCGGYMLTQLRSSCLTNNHRGLTKTSPTIRCRRRESSKLEVVCIGNTLKFFSFVKVQTQIFSFSKGSTIRAVDARSVPRYGRWQREEGGRGEQEWAVWGRLGERSQQDKPPPAGDSLYYVAMIVLPTRWCGTTWLGSQRE